jgi:D-threo-aldose 1-dehydrogenase
MAELTERAALGWANLGGLACAKPPTPAVQLAVFERAHQLGVRTHDTAIDYGRGFAEEGLGTAWTSHRVGRNQLRIQSKVLRRIVAPKDGAQPREADLWRCPEPYARLITTWDWSYAGTLQAAAESRERLRIEYHDGLGLHDPVEAVNQAGMRLADLGTGALAALRELQQKGLLREIGIGTKDLGIIPELLRVYPKVFDYIMIMNYNLLDHHRCMDELIPLCREKGIRLFLAGPYASGILASSVGQLNPTYYYQRAQPDVIRKVELLLGLAQEYGMKDLRPAAVQFVAANEAFSKIVFGGRTPEEFEENISNLSYPIPTEFWSRLRELKAEGQPIIHPKAPLPAKT